MAYTNSTDDIIWAGVDSDRESGAVNIFLYVDSDSVPTSSRDSLLKEYFSCLENSAVKK